MRHTRRPEQEPPKSSPPRHHTPTPRPHTLRHRPAATAPLARSFGTQCTGRTLSPHPPAATAASSAPAPGATASRSTAHHHSAPSPSTAPRAPQRPIPAMAATSSPTLCGRSGRRTGRTIGTQAHRAPPPGCETASREAPSGEPSGRPVARCRTRFGHPFSAWNIQ
ncbi:hypothetical protein GCM10010320_55800 [Streptomyces caelestis]|nr:hypothetical protein GCM10010320_55800 [Streptomyces caelestis]